VRDELDVPAPLLPSGCLEQDLPRNGHRQSVIFRFRIHFRSLFISVTTAMEKYRAVLLQGRCESTWSQKHPSYSIPPFGCKRCQRTPNPLRYGTFFSALLPFNPTICSDCVVRALVVLGEFSCLQPFSHYEFQFFQYSEADIAFRKTAAAILRNRRRHSGAEHWNKAYKCRK
jgi:hypothetical protein